MTDDNIKEVINRTSIVDIINSTIPLKKKGNNYFGLSPFKKEKTPSFSVNEEKKIFHCFSTGEHGNVIDFLIKVKGYDFKDALNENSKPVLIEFVVDPEEMVFPMVPAGGNNDDVIVNLEAADSILNKDSAEEI